MASDDDGMEAMRRSFENGEMTIELLLHSSHTPPPEQVITAEIIRLDQLIEAEKDEARKDCLCAAFQALNWARSSTGFAPYTPA